VEEIEDNVKPLLSFGVHVPAALGKVSDRVAAERSSKTTGLEGSDRQNPKRPSVGEETNRVGLKRRVDVGEDELKDVSED
jgi:hypothetical protein